MQTFMLAKTSLKMTLLMTVFLVSILGTASVSTFQSPVIQNVPQAKLSAELVRKIAVEENTPIPVIIRTHTEIYSQVVKDIARVGGTVNVEFENIKALSASVPANKIYELARNNKIRDIALDRLIELEGEDSLPSGDYELPLAVPADLADVEPISLSISDIAKILSDYPQGYWGYRDTKAVEIWPNANYGEGTIIAVIDTGVYQYHPYLYPRVIEGPSFVPAEREPDGVVHSSVAVENHYHGTACAGDAAGAVGLLFPTDHWFVDMVRWEIPDAVIDGPYDTIVPEGYSLIPLFGMAPLAQIYAIKVFDIWGRSTLTSIVMQGVDHAITMKKTGEVDIDVISMSIGGPSLYDGRSAEEELIDEATKAGIVCSIAAGNSGPAPFTVERPGTSFSAITVGAGLAPEQVRMMWNLWGGPANFDGLTTYYSASTGELLYEALDDPPGRQIIYYSGRGPSWDGRILPDVVAGTYGFTSLLYDSDGDGYNDDWTFGTMGGTSASTPVVSGGAALLVAAFPDADPSEIKYALTEGAEPFRPELGYDKNDFGSGWINLENSYNKMLDEKRKFEQEYEWIHTIKFDHGVFTADIVGLKHGEKMDFNFWIEPETDAIEVEITDITWDSGSEQTNWLWPLITGNPETDSLELYVSNPKHGYEFYYVYSLNVAPGDDPLIVIPFDQTSEDGYVRVTVEGDWTNWSPMSAKITIRKISYYVFACRDKVYAFNLHGYSVPTTTTIYDGSMNKFYHKIGQDELYEYQIKVPEGTTRLFLELKWIYDWSMYPTNDLDAYIIDPSGTYEYVYDMATLNSPEHVIIENPEPGTWTILVYGYEVYKTDRFQLSATMLVGVSADDTGIAVVTGTLTDGYQVILGMVSVPSFRPSRAGGGSPGGIC